MAVLLSKHDTATFEVSGEHSKIRLLILDNLDNGRISKSFPGGTSMDLFEIDASHEYSMAVHLSQERFQVADLRDLQIDDDTGIENEDQRQGQSSEILKKERGLEENDSFGW